VRSIMRIGINFERIEWRTVSLSFSRSEYKRLMLCDCGTGGGGRRTAQAYLTVIRAWAGLVRRAALVNTGTRINEVARQAIVGLPHPQDYARGCPTRDVVKELHVPETDAVGKSAGREVESYDVIASVGGIVQRLERDGLKGPIWLVSTAQAACGWRCCADNPP
jgi:hypothetical protein